MTRRFVSLDFETYSSVNLKTKGLQNYVDSPDFDIIVVASVDLHTGECRVSDSRLTIAAHIQELLSDSNIQLIAHNALFEYVTSTAYCRKNNMMEAGLARFWDTAALTAQLGLPRSLEDGCQFLYGEGKQPDGKALINLLSCPDKNGNRRDPKDYPEQWERYKSYCLLDARLCARLFTTLPALPDIDRRYQLSVWRMNLRGFKVDIPAINRILSDIDNIKADSNSMVAALTEGKITKATQGDRIKEWLAERGYETKSLSVDQVNKWLDDPELPDDVRQLMYARLKGSKATFGKYSAFLRYADKTGRDKHGYLYHGAHTGRLTGVDFQPQNISYDKTGTIVDENDKPVRSDKVLDMFMKGTLPKEWDRVTVLIAMTRSVIITEPGKKLYGVDYNAIEARIQCWLADDEKHLAMYRRNEDLYKPMAAIILQKPVGNVDKKERNKYGKVSILGGGYGMGPPKFSATYDLSIEEAKRCVTAFRQEYPKIKNYWKTLEDAFTECIKFKRPTRAGKVRYSYHQIAGYDYVRCMPPGGKPIFYLEPKVEQVERTRQRWINGEMKEAKGWDTEISYRRVTHKGDFRVKTWGGTLMENCIARDTLVLTQTGWIPIQSVVPEHKVWDGYEWVGHSGLVNKGVQTVINVYGAWMTPEHEVLTENGWKHAELCEGLNRAESRLPDGFVLSRVNTNRETPVVMAGGLCVRNEESNGHQRISKITQERAHQQLRVQTERNSAETEVPWDVSASCVLGMALHDRPLPSSFASGLRTIWWAGHNSLLGLAKRFRVFLEGYGANLSARIFSRPDRQQSGVHTPELPLDDGKTASQQFTQQRSDRHTARENVLRSSRSPVRREKNNDSVSNIRRAPNAGSIQTRKTEVYDIINAGPRSRFMVLADGEPLIVHNCCQSIAGTIIKYGTLNVEGLNVGAVPVLQSHDELVCEIPDGMDVSVLDAAMVNIPGFEGLPLAVESEVTERYVK